MAWPDTWPKGNEKVPWLYVESLPQPANLRRYYSRRKAAAPRMNKPQCVGRGIKKEYWQTVRCGNGQNNSRGLRDKSVNLGNDCATVGFCDNGNLLAMYHERADDCRWINSLVPKKGVAILLRYPRTRSF